ncbi:hypothetical protein AB0H76_17910 [Nocardia sp. NPDC050712]|uniref:hypothetical protein n=1 Tax=Nocardia sp. NPDC050712 TaxID=3155518 RepID=UPI00340FB3B8
MPLGLLLQKVTAALRATAAALAPWADIAGRETLIVERARSAFLLHWFGRRLPMQGLALRAHITNFGALNTQFLAAQRAVPVSRGGPNLTEPLAGVAGMIGGMLLSPAGMIAGVSVLLRFSAFSLSVLLAALAWIVLPFLLGFGMRAAPVGTGILVGGGLLAAGAGFALAAALGDRREIRAVFDLFGALARLMNGSVALLEQLGGPRGEVRNPLLAKILDLGDRLAGLLAQLLGAVAVLVVKIAPVLEPAARMMAGIARLGAAVFAALGEVVAGMVRQGEELSTGEGSLVRIVEHTMTVVRGQLRRVGRTVDAQLSVLVAAVTGIAAAVSVQGSEFLDTAGEFVGKLFLEHPIVRVFAALGKELALVELAFAAPRKIGPPKPPALSIPALPLPRPLRPFPPLPSAPDKKTLKQKYGGDTLPALTWPALQAEADELARLPGDDAPLALGPGARAALAATRKRPSIFDPERAELATGLLGANALWDLDPTQITRFREAFALIIGRVLPPELRGLTIPGLVDPEELPVLDLPDSEDLRPIVHTLRLRVPGANLTEVRNFQDLVLERLRQRSYAIPAGGQ